MFAPVQVAKPKVDEEKPLPLVTYEVEETDKPEEKHKIIEVIKGKFECLV